MASFTLVDSSTAAVASSNTSPVHVPEIDCAPLSPMQEGVEGMEMLSYLLGTDVIKSGMTNELLGAHDLGSNLTFDEFEFDLGTAIQEAPLSSSSTSTSSSSTVSPSSISTLTTQPTAAAVVAPPSSTFIPSSCFVSSSSSSSSSSRPQQQQPHSSLAVAVQEFPSAGSPASYDSESESGDDQPQAMSRSSTTARKGGRGAAASSKAAAAAAASAAAAAGRNDPGRNARMAKENRERKKQYISGLEGTIEQLKSEIKRLNADKAAMAKQLATAAVEIDTLKVTLNNQQALNPFFQALQTIPGLCLAGAPLAAAASASASASDSSAAPGSKRANNNNNTSSSGKSSRSKRVRADNSNDDDDDSVIVTPAAAAAPVTIPLLLNIQLVQPPK